VADDAGGAIYGQGGVTWPITIKDTTIENNVASGPGGGLHTHGGNVNIKRSNFFFNNSAASEGGGITKSGPGNTQIVNSHFEGNTATLNGGGVSLVFADGLKIRGSTFDGNFSAAGGGALSTVINTVPGTISNSTFSENGATDGGDIFVTGELKLANVTLAEATSGHSIYNFINPSVTQSVELRNTIVSDAAPDGCFGTVTTVGHNLEEGGNTCGFNAGSDVLGAALLGALVDHGGPTWTRALLVGSDALDAGSPTIGGSTGCTLVDQRGVPRPSGTACDIGAYEGVATTCGDGGMQGLEECDDGDVDARDGCTNACTICGNGVVTAPERCDDGNLDDDDGCLSTCQRVRDFTYYKARTTKGTAKFTPALDVDLLDGFGPMTVDLKKSAGLLYATSRNAGDPGAPSESNRLRRYSAKSQTQFTAVPNQTVTTDFGTEMLDVLKPAALLVPTEEHSDGSFAPEVDHFVCYKVRRAVGSPDFVAPAAQTIEDDLADSRLDLKKITQLCVPADVEGQSPGAENHEGALLCYKGSKSKVAEKFERQLALPVANELGSEVIDVTGRSELCVPAAVAP
jgi:cysteine-rich repeat protein